MSNADPNLHIREYLTYYTGLERPRFATLITGSWGVGKTWLVRTYFKDHADTKHVYVSLYGAQNADEIAQRLFVALHPILASKGVAIAGRIIKGLLKVSVAVNLDGTSGEDTRVAPEIPGVEDASAVAQSRMRFRDTTLVLDDLERCSAQPPELWGFVNRLMEQDGARVVLLANEEKLSDKEHRETKEKNIGLTLRVAPDISNILPAFIRGESERLLAHEEQIRQVLEVAACENLRVIRFAIRDLGRVLDNLSGELLKNADAISSIVAATLALGIEVYSGNVTAQMLPKLSMARYMSRRAGGVTDDQDESQLRYAFAKYAGLLEVGYVAPSLRWWQDFFERGAVDQESLNAELAARFDKTDNRPSWLRITALSTLTDAEFDALLDETWTSLTRHDYRVLGEMLHVAGIQLWASRNGLSGRALSEIFADTKSAMDALENVELFSGYRFESADEQFEAYASRRFADHDSPEFRDLIAHARLIQAEAIRAHARLKARELLVEIAKGAKAFDTALDDRVEGLSELDKAALSTPVLCEMDATEFVSRLLNLPATDLNSVVGTLYRRLRALGRKEEIEWARLIAQTAMNGTGLRRLIAGRRLEQLVDG